MLLVLIDVVTASFRPLLRRGSCSHHSAGQSPASGPECLPSFFSKPFSWSSGGIFYSRLVPRHPPECQADGCEFQATDDEDEEGFDNEEHFRSSRLRIAVIRTLRDVC